MSAITIQLSDELSERIRGKEERLPEMELALEVSGVVFQETTAILEFLAGMPSPQEVLNLHSSDCLNRRINELLDANRSRGLTPQEQREWEPYEHMEHLVRMAKIKADMKLNGQLPPNV